MAAIFEGVIIKSTGSWYVIRNKQGEYLNARIKGKFRMEGIRTTNPISVGDNVTYSLEDDGNGLIQTIGERKNYIIRKSVNLSKQSHIVASNIDCAYLIVTINHPHTSTGFIDRFLISAEAYQIPVVLLFNKTDIYSEADKAEMNYLTAAYTKIGYECMQTSTVSGEGIEALKTRLKDTVSMLSGHSGSGKSSIINCIDSQLRAKIGIISESHSKGKHTTTFAEMFPLQFGGDIIDTPGIKGFGLHDIDKSIINLYYKEMKALLPECKFHNCKHINEPKCAVLNALEAEEIEEFRYKNYLSMYYNEEGVR